MHWQLGLPHYPREQPLWLQRPDQWPQERRQSDPQQPAAFQGSRQVPLRLQALLQGANRA